MERKKLDVPIRDFDTDDYGTIEFIPKDVSITVESEKIEHQEETPAYKNLSEAINSDIENKNTGIPLVDGTKLFEYFKKRFQECHGYSYPADAGNEVNIFEDFKNRYGDNAGPMVKILFDKHQGKLSAVDGIITINAFKRGAKWIQDMLYCEVQEDKKRNLVDTSTEGLMSARDLIRFFSVAE